MNRLIIHMNVSHFKHLIAVGTGKYFFFQNEPLEYEYSELFAIQTVSRSRYMKIMFLHQYEFYERFTF